MSNTSNAMAMMEKYSTASVKAPKTKNECRVAVGQVFMQPTKTNTNFKYCYYGVSDKDGQFISGFNMSNKSMLELVAADMLPEAFATCFAQYAEKFAATQTVL